MKFIVAWVLLAAAAVISACGSTFQYQRFADQQGWLRLVLNGQGFQHLALYDSAELETKRLRVYLEGDGSPWRYGRYPSADPTAKRPLALQLMALDSTSRLYLARPCYHILNKACTSDLWTAERYSAAVVNSMLSALAEFRRKHHFSEVEIVAYSGGATLAVLMADKIPGLRRIITLAGNLDTAQWVADKAYLPLRGSLDPIVDADLNGVEHTHFVGAKDNNILPRYSQAFVRAHGGQRHILHNYDHVCCWLQDWPALMER
ncbi:MAG: hypothetical protein OIF38_07375 [Cellvibrionaceae bacterium]|nr:hypothetical protein [Cellvibrionaceae bacterium]